jgi:NAD(P)-dependent dehydrogenase (short-subunit alcohol dehydrogenase family)
VVGEVAVVREGDRSFGGEESRRGEGSVLVTGASSGIGEATVSALVQRGFHVWATVRREVDEQRLVAEHADRVTVRRCDITDPEQVSALGADVVAAGLVGVVSNAGTAVPAPLEYLPLEQLRYQLEVNLVGQLAVVQVVLPALRRTRGRVVVVGSIGDRIATPMLGAYNASKFGLLGLTDSLRAELAPSGIRVVLVEPGMIATRIWDSGRTRGEELLATAPPEATRYYQSQIDRLRTEAGRAADRGLPASAVADVITKAITARNPRPRYLVGRDAHVAALIARLPHRLRYRLTAARG